MKILFRHPIPFFVAVISILLPVGCVTIKESRLQPNFSEISVGMTEKEVIALIGLPEKTRPPSGRQPTIGAKFLRWEVSEGPEDDRDVLTGDVIFDKEGRVLAKNLTIFHHRRTHPEFSMYPNEPAPSASK